MNTTALRKMDINIAVNDTMDMALSASDIIPMNSG